MQNVSRVDVYAVDKHVGTLAEYERGLIAFEYSQEWLESGFSISPFSLPLEKKLFVPSSKELGGLFGVFDDSLPDGWGRLLTDRYLRLKGFDASEVNQLERLLLLPDTAFGRLEYKPRQDFSSIVNTNDFDHFFEASKAILDDFKISEDDVEKLYKYGGSSGGARPKINALIDGELWIVKLPSSGDGIDAGIKEYECNKRAVDAGLDVSDFMLVDSKLTKGFFASKRFDRKDGRRVHMVSLAGLLESSYRYPALDYSHLLKATFLLTRSEQEVYEAFRRACFNVFVGNQDDHGKNFAFLYDEIEGKWHLSPAYDLTRSITYYGEHSTTVCGKGRDIKDDDLRKLASSFSLKESNVNEIIRDVKAVSR